jgi:hypothetical protein
MKDKYGNTLKYSNREHVFRTKRLKYQRLIKNYKDRYGISEVENRLSKYNSKSCNYDNFKEFIKYKNKINELLFDNYNNDIFRKYKWYGYINRKKTETYIVNKIKNKFGNNVKICYGDWSIPKQMKNFISTPNISLKRKLHEYFTIYNLDEFRTSCLNCKTEEKCENMYLPDKQGKFRKIHSILTYQTKNKSLGCINRDSNSCNNMIKIMEFYFEHKKRPEKFTRNYKIKDDNPKEKTNNLILGVLNGREKLMS